MEEHPIPTPTPHPHCFPLPTFLTRSTCSTAWSSSPTAGGGGAGVAVCAAPSMPAPIVAAVAAAAAGRDMDGVDFTSVADDALSALDRMEGTVNDVLDFRKLDANLFTMSMKPVDVSALLRSVCMGCRGFLSHRVGLRWRVVVAPGCAAAPVMLDSRRVFQILTNGLRYAGGGGRERERGKNPVSFNHPHPPPPPRTRRSRMHVRRSTQYVGCLSRRC
jgi:hypothetical protein